jgi:hypothetical protein
VFHIAKGALEYQRSCLAVSIPPVRLIMSSQPYSRDGDTLIQIDTIEDWERLRSNFTDAMERALDAQLGPTGSLAVRDALRQHLIHVSQ